MTGQSDKGVASWIKVVLPALAVAVMSLIGWQFRSGMAQAVCDTTQTEQIRALQAQSDRIERKLDVILEELRQDNKR